MKKILTNCILAVVFLFALCTVSTAAPIYFGEVNLLSAPNPYTWEIGNGGMQFESFCLEKGEWAVVGNTYTAYENEKGAVNGGISGGNPDPISFSTAYLYLAYLGGGYSAIDTQNAIWYLEGEKDWNAISATAQGFVTEANLATANWSTTRGVTVLNMYNADGSVAQDMLYVPEPMSILLLGLGILGLGITRKIRK